MVALAQFDICRIAGPGQGERKPRLAVVLQHDILSDLSTRVVAPLIGAEEVGFDESRVMPSVSIGGKKYAVAMHLCAAVPARALSEPIGSIASEQATIKNALDLLFLGF
jgi:toxin CcdB